MEFKKPLDIDYDHESAEEIMDKIMHTIEQTPAYNVLHEYDQELERKKQEEEEEKIKNQKNQSQE